jgi:Fe2+ transport system protein FeoA
MTLETLNPGDNAIVVRVSGNGAVSRRMADMGIVPGRRLTLIRRAPLGDPIDISLMGYHLTLRMAEANRVIVKLADN